MRLPAPLGVAEQAREHPDVPALTNLRETWTFGDLGAHAAAVATMLVARADDRPVVVLVDRSLHSVSTMLGVWWAGRGVVALDVDEPDLRIAEFAERAGARLVINASARVRAEIGHLEVAVPPSAERDASKWVDVQARPPETVAIYQFTSGSTGRAKCVGRTFGNLIRAVDLYFTRDGVLSMQPGAITYPLHFAMGCTATLTGLGVGRFTALVDVREWGVDQLLRMLTDLQIERLYATPSVVRALAASSSPGGGVPSLQKLWMIGERCYWADVTVARALFGEQLTVASGYGASEAMSMVCTMIVRPGDAIEGDGPLPLGFMAYADAMRVDTDLHSDGPGEILFRGELAAGYVDDPELTAQRFGLDHDGVRMWRSGDLASLDERGRYVHRGRLDDMVKINGTLVEPAETEAALRSIEGLRDAVVLVHTTPSGRSILVAHVVVGPDVSVDAVRAALRERLPAHLVPRRIIRHDELPVTDRGKVDRDQLRKSVGTTATAADASGSPEDLPAADDSWLIDPVLEAIVRTARLLLEDDALGPHDNLWDAGCDSLTALELVKQLESEVGTIDAADLVAISSCSDLAARLHRGRRRPHHHVSEWNAGASDAPMVLVLGGGSPPFSYRHLKDALGTDQHVVVFEQRGLHRRGRRDRSVQSAAAGVLREVRKRQPTGPYVLAGYSWGGLVAHEVARLLDERGERVSLVLLDAYRTVAPDGPAIPPSRVRERSDSWLVWRMKRVVWQAAVLRRRLPGGWVLMRRPIGSVARYREFFLHALRTVRRHAAPPIDIPTTLVYPAGSEVATMWDDHPNLVKVQVGGDHNSMICIPHVAAVAEAVLAARCRSAG